MHAYCFASGEIDFGKKVPDGALPIARGPAKPLREFIETVSRHGYKTEEVNGRPTKIPGSDVLLVPGIPEADDQDTALDALFAFTGWIKKHRLPAGVTVR